MTTTTAALKGARPATELDPIEAKRSPKPETSRPAVPWGKVVIDGVRVVSARCLPSMRELPAVLGPERVAVLADQARVRFHAAA